MTIVGNEKEKCIDGSRYRFVPNEVSIGPVGNGNTPPQQGDGSSGAVAYYLSQLVNMLQPIYEHYAAWQGVITSREINVPADAQRKKYQIYPAARTIRIETDAPINIWINEDRGVSIPLGGERRVLYLSDLPPKAAIHDIYVTSMAETNLSILTVA
ncbi:MAG: hypothetical protein WCR85_00185 [Sphaerochaeta sp.]